MKNLKKLSRNQLKNIFGGGEDSKLNPNNSIEIIDIGGEGGGSEGGGGRRFKCCWNNSDGCSGCVTIRTNPVCVSGSYPVAC